MILHEGCPPEHRAPSRKPLWAVAWCRMWFLDGARPQHQGVRNIIRRQPRQAYITQKCCSITLAMYCCLPARVAMRWSSLASEVVQVHQVDSSGPTRFSVQQCMHSGDHELMALRGAAPAAATEAPAAAVPAPAAEAPAAATPAAAVAALSDVGNTTGTGEPHHR
jgi:hypothetical protein